jgi:hypothetical protein
MTRIETVRKADGSWIAYVVQHYAEVANGVGKTKHEAVLAAKRALAADLAEARREQDEEAELFSE